MKMTVYFDGAFWSALIEFTDSKKHYKAFRYVFGKEPKDDDILNFIDVSLEKWLRRYDKVKVSSEFSAPAISQKKRNPKRVQRDINKAKCKPVVSTKAQLAMQEMHEQAKKMKQSDRKLRRELEKERKFTLKQEKRHQKKRGH
ncbi:DUF2992 family protein [Streptococcus sp. KCJ4932]|uniref:YjdF family protein n=1 Tax=Streptococcus sp. KCJ4932 TaxID=2545465 RepID=UPI0010542E6C|nr:YjdF family protein [Streptococcus sp. KCJ4932]TDE67559.1 DUF2992 family protein [Streptococcus sp. KCJ4932]